MDTRTVNDYLSYDKLTGLLKWKSDVPSHYFSSVRYCKMHNIKFGGNTIYRLSGSGYIVLQVQRRIYQAHRLIWLMVKGQFPKGQIDHINGDKTDNRLVNLRDVTHHTNGLNQKMSKRNKSGCTGVGWHIKSNKWKVEIQVNKKYKYLGTYQSLDEAIKVRKKAEALYGYHTNHGRNA